MQQGCPILLLSVVTKATATLLFLFLFSILAAHIIISHTKHVQCNQICSCKQTSRTNLPHKPPAATSPISKKKSLTFCTQSLLQRSRTRPLWQRALTRSLFRCLFARSHFRCLFAHGRFRCLLHTAAFLLPFHTVLLQFSRTRSLFCHLAC